MEHKDKRLKWTSEILAGIKVSLITKTVTVNVLSIPLITEKIPFLGFPPP